MAGAAGCRFLPVDCSSGKVRVEGRDREAMRGQTQSRSHLDGKSFEEIFYHFSPGWMTAMENPDPISPFDRGTALKGAA